MLMRQRFLAFVFASACLLVPALASAQQFVNGTLQSAAVANGNGAVLRIVGMATITVTVNCSGCSGGTTVNFEGTENGSNFVALAASPSGATSPAFATSTAAAGVTAWSTSVAGYQGFRARISGYSAGTVTVTGTAVPLPMVTANLPVIGALSSGAPTPLIACTKVAQGSNASSGNTRIITGVSGQLTRICGWHVWMGSTATGWSLTAGTGSNCGTGTSTILGSSSVLLPAGADTEDNYEFYHGINAQANTADVCINLSANNSMTYIFFYDQE
jgi:hypothetical protein